MATATRKKKKAAGKSTATKKSTRTAAKKSSSRKSAPKKKWSRRVNETSDALDLEHNIFKSGDPKKIARSLKRSAEKSNRRKGTPYQSAMSMLNFYINRGGRNLGKKEKQPLEAAKDELRALFHRDQ